MIKLGKDKKKLRRLALSAQGLLKAQAFGRGLAGARKAIHHIGYVQLDTISVIERAHHHVLASRVPDFKPEMINKMLIEKDIFEYWTHAAAVIPMEDFRFSLPYKQAIKMGQRHWFKHRDQKLMAELLARIEAEGPLRSRDLETKTKKSTGWWQWKPAKQALEQLYMEGDLMVCHRQGFQKTYDLTARVLPPEVNCVMPTIEEFAAHLVDQQCRCHGIVSLKGLTYLRKNNTLLKAVKHRLNNQLASHQLQPVQLNTGELFFIEVGAFDHPLPRAPKRLKILSPFDNSVIQRDRLKSLFDFDYQLECYVPAQKRQFGYFSLPLLYGDSFIGRMDCKAHRQSSQLEIRSLYLESDNFDKDQFIDAFALAMKDFCRFQQCTKISLSKVAPQRLTKPLQGAINSMMS